MPSAESPKKSKRARPEKDVSIDLTAPDAIERLDRIHDELGSPPEAGEDPITPEDEQEEAEHDAEIDRERDEFNLDDMRFWRHKACNDAGDEIDAMRNAGYSEKDLARIAGKMADGILKEEARLNALRVKSGLLEKKPSVAEDLVKAIMARAEEARADRPASQQGTAVLDLKKPEADDEDPTAA